MTTRVHPSEGTIAAFVVGLIGCAVGIVVGFAMAVHSVDAVCGQNDFGDDNGNCYRYPHAGMGVSIVALSVALAAVLTIGWSIAKSLTEARFEAAQVRVAAEKAAAS